MRAQSACPGCLPGVHFLSVCSVCVLGVHALIARGACARSARSTCHDQAPLRPRELAGVAGEALHSYIYELPDAPAAITLRTTGLLYVMRGDIRLKHGEESGSGTLGGRIRARRRWACDVGGAS